MTILLIALIAFSIAQASTNLKMVKEFDSYDTVTGTLESFYSKRKVRIIGLSRVAQRETSYYFKLAEYPTLFKIGKLSKKAFDWESFAELNQGKEISLKYNPRNNLKEEGTLTLSLIWNSDRQFIDKEIRNRERKMNGWLAIFFFFAFSGGLIHHIKKPWI